MMLTAKATVTDHSGNSLITEGRAYQAIFTARSHMDTDYDSAQWTRAKIMCDDGYARYFRASFFLTASEQRDKTIDEILG
jgi:hypothetical protein